MDSTFKGHVFMNNEGHYAVVRESTTHTGHHVTLSFIKELDQADVFTAMHLAMSRRKFAHLELDQLAKLPAQVKTKREVRFITPEELE